MNSRRLLGRRKSWQKFFFLRFVFILHRLKCFLPFRTILVIWTPLILYLESPIETVIVAYHRNFYEISRFTCLENTICMLFAGNVENFWNFVHKMFANKNALISLCSKSIILSNWIYRFTQTIYLKI